MQQLDISPILVTSASGKSQISLMAAGVLPTFQLEGVVVGGFFEKNVEFTKLRWFHEILNFLSKCKKLFSWGKLIRFTNMYSLNSWNNATQILREINVATGSPNSQWFFWFGYFGYLESCYNAVFGLKLTSTKWHLIKCMKKPCRCTR